MTTMVRQSLLKKGSPGENPLARLEKIYMVYCRQVNLVHVLTTAVLIRSEYPNKINNCRFQSSLLVPLRVQSLRQCLLSLILAGM